MQSGSGDAEHTGYMRRDALLGAVDPEREQALEALTRIQEVRWPYSFKRTGTLAEVREIVKEQVPAGEPQAPPEKKDDHAIAGRVRAKRRSSRFAFLDLHDATGRLQVVLDPAVLGELHETLLKIVHEGDFLGVTGFGLTTKTGEPSVSASEVLVLAKSLVPPPDTRQALAPETKYGRTYLSLLQSADARDVFVRRAAFSRSTRARLDRQGFVEAPIPVLEKVYGGANAQPFTTFSNAKKTQMYLRISHELALKKLLVGGLERVYHLGPAFRNEDIDTTHNPEFALLEVYAAYWDYKDMLRFTEKLLRSLAKEAAEASPDHVARLERLGVLGKFDQVRMIDALGDLAGLDVEKTDDERLARLLTDHGRALKGGFNRGLAIAELFEALVEPKLTRPTFVLDYPRETTPLCKPHRKHPHLVERFELYIGGSEHANAYSELNDPHLQAKLFEEQAQRREAGDVEAHPRDADFLDALKYGMPPAAGLGIGFDRLMMTLLGKDSIKDVILFPQTLTSV